MSDEIDTILKKMVASKNDILSSANLQTRYKEVTLRNMEVPIRIRSLNDREWTEISSAAFKKDGTIDKVMQASFAARLIVKCVVDEEGNRIFADHEAKELRTLDAGYVDELAGHIREHMGIKEPEETKNE
jgi:hypothetical protein